VLHPDRLVEPNRSIVLGADEETDRRNTLEEEAAEIREAPGAVPPAPHVGIDPHLLELHRRGRPRGCLGLEEDRPVLDPEPGAVLLDLASSPPFEALGVALQRIQAELLLVRRSAGGHEHVEVGERRRAKAGVPGGRRLPDDEHRLPRAVLAWAGEQGFGRVPEVGHGSGLADQHARRGLSDLAGEHTAALAGGDDVDPEMAQRVQLAVVRSADEATEATPGNVLEEHALHGILCAEPEDLVALGLGDLAEQAPNSKRGSALPPLRRFRRVPPMPIHLRANPGDYADACLLPGDPLRAQYIAETFLEDAVQVNEERGLLGFTGRWQGKPVSVQGTGMGCPSATIVFEELIQLGVTRLLRVGTCGGLQPGHALGDLIVAISAVPADSTATHLVGGEPHCPTASWELVHEAVHVAKHSDEPLRVGPIVSSDLFYNPDEGQYERWSKRGLLAVEMEAAALFTVAAIRGVHGGCLLTVSDIVVEGEFVRISDDELRAAVDRMTRIALDTATAA
jgi:DeoD family purine-nucleoside phosphorylase